MGDPICKWRSATPRNVVELVSSLPHTEMSEEDFKETIENKWPGFLRTPYQLACQLGLYVVNNGIYTPRFSHDINETEAKAYLEDIVTRYYVPNPYTPRGFKNIKKPIVLEKAIVNYIESNPNETDLKKIIGLLIMEEVGNFSSIKTFLSNSNVLDITKENVSLKPNYKEIMDAQLNRNDKATFFEYLKGTFGTISSAPSALSTSYLTAMRTKPFLLLAGISGTGKSRIVKQMAFESCPDIPALRSDKTAPGNYELIEVKPNWHDSSELLGYESEIGGPHYVVTPFVRFLVKAMRYPDVPFFVCMDEMNLAPVEQYFAEFLSVLESRKLLSDGAITSEPLIKADIFSKYADQLHRDLDITDTETYKAVYDRLKNDGLRLPSNLIVVGTVNMDETTHQFSRKVIDRAMTIEMNIEDAETPFKNFFEGGDALHYYDNPQPKELFLPKVVQASEALSILSAEDAAYLKENVPGLLHSLNSALNGTPFKIAYRVQNELILYFFSLREENPDEAAEALLAQAMDAILMMKVLPRIEGDEDLLDKPLKALAQFTENYPQASRKIAEMQERLPQAHFTCFWP